MTPFVSDQALLDGLSAGRSDAFERLYADHHAAIYNLCARVVCDREEAKDLTQEVFITAFNHLGAPGAEPVRKLRPWLYRVATNACFNHLRSRKRLDGGGDAQIENTASGVDEFERAQTVALVEASLGELNERYRTALVLKDLQGLPVVEIAEVLAISRPTADVLVHRARASFKAAFTKLAGDKIPAPAALGLVLIPLSVPAVLHAMPPLPHLTPAAHLPGASIPPHHGLHVPDLSSAAGPSGAGLLTKIGAALATKIGITAAAATVVIGGAVAVQDVRHADGQRWSGAMGHAWQPASAKWSKQWARWSLYSNWMQHGWPMGWSSGGWRWNSRSGWSWQMSNGSSWSSGGMTSGTSSWGGGWTMTTSLSGSSGWSSGGGGSGSGSLAKDSGSSGGWSGSGSKSGGSSSGSGSRSGGGWSGGSSGSMGGSGSSGGSWGGGSSGGSGW